MDVRDKDCPIPPRSIKIHVARFLFHNDARDLSQSLVTAM
jgi:hypothetical protein